MTGYERLMVCVRGLAAEALSSLPPQLVRALGAAGLREPGRWRSSSS